MRKLSPLLLLMLAVLLAACQQPKPDPRLDGIAQSATAAASASQQALELAEGLASDLDVLTAGQGALRTDVQALTGQAQALAAISTQVQGLVGVVARLDPAASSILTINHPPGLAVTVTPGACAGDLPPADETANATDTRSVSRLGLPVGPACLTSSDPPAQLEVDLAAGTVLGVYFNAPAPAD